MQTRSHLPSRPCAKTCNPGPWSAAARAPQVSRPHPTHRSNEGFPGASRALARTSTYAFLHAPSGRGKTRGRRARSGRAGRNDVPYRLSAPIPALLGCRGPSCPRWPPQNAEGNRTKHPPKFTLTPGPGPGILRGPLHLTTRHFRILPKTLGIRTWVRTLFCGNPAARHRKCNAHSRTAGTCPPGTAGGAGRRTAWGPSRTPRAPRAPRRCWTAAGPATRWSEGAKDAPWARPSACEEQPMSCLRGFRREPPLVRLVCPGAWNVRTYAPGAGGLVDGNAQSPTGEARHEHTDSFR